MRPTIDDGDLVLIDPAKIPPAMGTIVLFQQHKRLTLHRLIRHNPGTNSMLTTGDASLRGIETTPADTIIGIGQSVRRGSRTRRLDSVPARYLGLLLFYTRPLRRLINSLWFHLRRKS